MVIQEINKPITATQTQKCRTNLLLLLFSPPIHQSFLSFCCLYNRKTYNGKKSALFPLLPYSLLKDNASAQKGEIFNFQGLDIEKKLQQLPLPFTFMHSILCCLPVFNFLQVAFKTGDYKQQLIFIGGLTDGFLATEYVSYYIPHFHLPSFPLVHSLLHLCFFC